MTLADTAVAAHASHLMAKADGGHAACGEKSDCGSGDAVACAAACAGLVSSISFIHLDAFEEQFTTTRVRPADLATFGQNPELSERPPKTRLL